MSETKVSVYSERENEKREGGEPLNSLPVCVWRQRNGLLLESDFLKLWLPHGNYQYCKEFSHC